MKHMNLMKCLLALCYLGVIAACSSENAIVENVKVTDIVTSDCKSSASKEDSRPEHLADFYSNKTKLLMFMGKDNTVTAQFLDVMDNCAIGQLNVDVSCSENKIVIILYPDRDMYTNCVCMYDVNFKIRNLLFGNYLIEIYQTTSNKQTSSYNRIYQGSVTLESNKTLTLTMTR